MNHEFINGIKKQFDYYKSIGEKTIEQLSDQQLNWKPNETSNSIANIVMHLHGNMLSRWTNFLSEDGEKTWRRREEEFDNKDLTKSEILSLWQEGWSCLYDAITKSETIDLTTIIYIRAQAHTLIDAFLRQLAHYPHHVGQIVYIGKVLLDRDWKTLSIPRGGTDDFNRIMFSGHKQI
ncbi:MAG TPA: DUF1572 family protein [Saprospiraceae bacterium]|nr:DUF1572 family protein [Saprospiraceae bacterium]